MILVSSAQEKIKDQCSGLNGDPKLSMPLMCWKGFGTDLPLAFSPAFTPYPHIVWSQ